MALVNRGKTSKTLAILATWRTAATDGTRLLLPEEDEAVEEVGEVEDSKWDVVGVKVSVISAAVAAA